MAVLKGERRRATGNAAKQARAGWNTARRKLSPHVNQRWCPWCKPGHWVRLAQWDAHYQQVSFRLAQEREARKAANKPPPAPPPQRPPRPKNPTKPSPTTRPASPKEPPVSATNGSAPAPAPVGRQVSATAPEGIAEAFRLWALLVPPSIPAARFDAAAMADAYRRAADSLRHRLRMELEENNLPEQCLEPYHQAANLLSQLGDLHMEVVRRVEIRYGEVAEILGRPDTPNAEYLKGGR